jgi:DnaJ family protein C protein 2
MARIRELVDNAYNCDPRIIKFREADKERKMAGKRARQDALRQQKEEEERVRRAAEEEARKAKEIADAEEKAKQDAAKKEKEQLKKALKKERKTLRTFLKERDYFAPSNNDRVQAMADLDKICEDFTLEK